MFHQSPCWRLTRLPSTQLIWSRVGRAGLFFFIFFLQHVLSTHFFLTLRPAQRLWYMQQEIKLGPVQESRKGSRIPLAFTDNDYNCMPVFFTSLYCVTMQAAPFDLYPLLPPRLCNGLSGPSRPPGACVPLLRVRTRIPLLYSWGGCDSPRGQRSLRGQDCQDLPRGEHDGHHAWLPSGGQRQSGPGPGARRSESASATTEPGLLHCTKQFSGLGVIIQCIIVSAWR